MNPFLPSAVFVGHFVTATRQVTDMPSYPVCWSILYLALTRWFPSSFLSVFKNHMNNAQIICKVSHGPVREHVASSHLSSPALKGTADYQTVKDSQESLQHPLSPPIMAFTSLPVALCRPLSIPAPGCVQRSVLLAVSWSTV